jgi:leucyl-tRNA synthetase
MIDYGAMEKKWQKRWEESKVYEPEPNERKPLLVTAAWPYVNMPLHIGHLKTYAITDMYSRYMRLSGYNTLFPMGFHYTGTPIIAIAKRIAERNKDVLEEIKVYNIPESELPKLSDPLYMAEYFAKDTVRGLRAAGLGIDWRRSFNSINPFFSKMVEWQFSKLVTMKLLEQGEHYVAWCTNEGNPVGQHDTKGDVHPEIEKVVMVAFKSKEGDASFLCTTYRPETIYGVSNLFIAKGAEYSIVSISGKDYYVSRSSAKELSYQLKMEVKGEISSDELLTKTALNPITGEEIPILPGFFVKESFGTGIVMSVPAHAPFDYIALKRLEKEGLQVPTTYKKVITLESDSEESIPSNVYLSMLGIDESASDDLIEEATKKLYSAESHNGKMSTGKYSGTPESEARELIKRDLLAGGNAIESYLISNSPVFCRCGTRAIVKIVNDQWFINYGDKAWKEKVKGLFASTEVYPKKMRAAYDYTIDWLDLRALERAQGLGTKFPLNPSHIIESLSDSTLYMAFYTISHIIASNSISPDKAKPEFFDYVFLGIGTADSVGAASGIDPLVIKRCRESFTYWYSNTSRHSASELIYSHLTMYLFAHAAIMPKEMFPKKIITNGMQLYEGKKMSKSLGNIVPIVDAIKKYGADNLRAIEIAGSELDTDTDFSVAAVSGLAQRNEFLYNTIKSISEMDSGGLRPIDYWMYSKLNAKISAVTKDMESLYVKSAFGAIYYDSVNEIKRYLERGSPNQIVLSEFLSKITILLSPFMPHLAEEFWEMLGNDGLAIMQAWPPADEGMINVNIEGCEDVIDATLSDIKDVISVMSPKNGGIMPSEAEIVVADEWKFKAYNSLVDSKKHADVITKAESFGATKEAVSKYIMQYKNPSSVTMKVPFTSDELHSAMEDALKYMSSKLGCPVKVYTESSSGSPRAARAKPEKPAIELKWGQS